MPTFFTAPLRSFTLAVTLAAICGLTSVPLVANDDIFPALPSAESKISWKDGYFVIDGKPTMLIAGEIHYARVPREQWRDRLMRAKRMGLNCIQTYVFWNAHEPREGTFDFSGQLDLDAWLKLIEELGMYAIVRPGPYNCAEWESGGVPSWLTVKPNMVVRDADPEYLKYADRYYEKVLPIIAKHQINKGGKVIAVQLENEYSGGWGTDKHPLLQHLYDKARELKLEVPLFYSGLHHGSHPAGDEPNAESFGKRTVPWYSTEMWIGWFNGGGEVDDSAVRGDAFATWRILAFGGGGYDYYVVHGGTNFGYSNDNENATTYDYFACIGESGQLRKRFRTLKFPATFASTFSDLLANSHEGKAEVSKGLRAFVRTSKFGTVTFVENCKDETLTTTVKLADPAGTQPSDYSLAVPYWNYRMVLTDVPLATGVTAKVIGSDVLGKGEVGGRTFVICHGKPGETGTFVVSAGAAKTPWTWNAANKQATASVTYPQGDEVVELPIGGEGKAGVTFLVMNTDLASRSWFVKDAVIVGPWYVNEDLSLEFAPTTTQAVIYTPSGKRTVAAVASPVPDLPTLSQWQCRDGSPEAAAVFDDKAWLSDAQPKNLSAYADFQNGYGWYRTTITGDGQQRSLLFGGIEDRAQVYLNGTFIGNNVGPTVTITPKAGPNTVALFTAHNGRSKLFGVAGKAGTLGYKGAWGPVNTLVAGAVLSDWRMDYNDQKEDQASTFAAPDFDDSTWKMVKPSVELQKQRHGYAWYRASWELTKKPAGAPMKLWLNGVDDEGWAYLNGTLIAHSDWSKAAVIDIDGLVKTGKNVVAVCVKNTDGEGGLTKAVMIGSPVESSAPWRFHGGLAGLDETAVLGTVTNWKAFLGGTWSAEVPATATPRFWHAEVGPVVPKTGFTTVGISTKGLSNGSVWVNGHNLGRYKGTVLLVVPECWLDDHNHVVVFDEQGASPKSVAFQLIESRQRISSGLK